ncbi:MAG: epoxyqueuosine reductase QueH [Bacilli bacterium]|nr:epoxyqueuosine reductase QueH [Bacilli bacterium]
MKNYQLELDKTLEKIKDTRPKLLLHVCCAPCSSYVLSYLSDYFDITVLYYNPNISPYEEYEKRLTEEKRLIKELNKNIHIMDCNYDSELFDSIAHGLEDAKEGGIRCYKCYNLRLEKTAMIAKKEHYDYFTTTLTISPLKNSQVLNKIGYDLEKKYDIKYLYSDFKKRDGYKTSIILSKKYSLYRQDYCGCIYSKIAREKEKALKEL